MAHAEVLIERKRPAPPPAPAWSKRELSILRDLYGTAGWDELGRALPGRTTAAIQRQAHAIGVQRRQETRASGPPPVGSLWRSSRNGGLLPAGIWRVVGLDGAGFRVVLEAVEPKQPHRWQVLTETFRGNTWRRLPDHQFPDDRRAPTSPVDALATAVETLLLSCEAGERPGRVSVPEAVVDALRDALDRLAKRRQTSDGEAA